MADFRRFAEREGLTIPAGAAADAALIGLLTPVIADAKWGEKGWYRVLATRDPDVRAALSAFGQAARILR